MLFDHLPPNAVQDGLETVLFAVCMVRVISVLTLERVAPCVTRLRVEIMAYLVDNLANSIQHQDAALVSRRKTSVSATLLPMLRNACWRAWILINTRSLLDCFDSALTASENLKSPRESVIHRWLHISHTANDASDPRRRLPVSPLDLPLCALSNGL